MSLTSEALSQARSHLRDVESFIRLSYIVSTPYSTKWSPISGCTEGPDNNLSAPEEEPPLDNWGYKSEDGHQASEMRLKPNWMSV